MYSMMKLVPGLSITVAIALSACIMWDAVNRSGNSQQLHITSRLRRLQSEQENSQQGKQEEEQGMLKENYASMQKREKKAFNDTDASDANDANEFGINNPAIDIAFKSGLKNDSKKISKNDSRKKNKKRTNQKSGGSNFENGGSSNENSSGGDNDTTPTKNPTKVPTVSPSNSPTKAPSKTPTNTPTKAPTSSPRNDSGSRNRNHNNNGSGNQNNKNAGSSNQNSKNDNSVSSNNNENGSDEQNNKNNGNGSGNQNNKNNGSGNQNNKENGSDNSSNSGSDNQDKFNNGSGNNQNTRSGNQNNNNNGNNNGSANADKDADEVVLDHDLWRKRGDQSGLTVEVLNNLDPNSVWNGYLEDNVQAWGSSDALSLSLRTIDTYDPDCNVALWTIKVCNSNFGDTRWKGVNRIMLNNGKIVASMAKMNDYYLPWMDKHELLYTMCHELGHGFGLKHSDENFNNNDLGDCMDYTLNHQNNMSPGWANFEALQDMYGSVNEDDARHLRAKHVDTPGDGRMSKDEEMRMLKDFDKYSAHLSDPVIVSSQNRNNGGSQGSRRLLRENNNVENHEIHLGDGYSIRTTMLLA